MFSQLGNKTDEEIMRLVQSGKTRALTELYKRYSTKMVRYFHRMLWKDEPRAQDMLHDLFIKIVENPERIDPDKKFSTWLYSVAFNMCKNEYRKHEFRLGVGKYQNDERNVLQPDIDHQDFAKRIEMILRHAEEDERNLFVLKYELEMPLSEIATILQCPEGTVKSRLFYLKKKIALQLQEYNPAINY